MNLGGVIRLNKTGFCVLLGATVLLFIYMLTNSSSSNKAPPTLKINLKQLLKVAIKAAENGGKEVVASKDNLNIKSKGLTKEGLQDSVTTADYLSHCAIVKTLENAYPNLRVISEEQKVKCGEAQKIDFSADSEISTNLGDHWEDVKDVTVWIDPLDATYEYTEKLYGFVTTMVCVAVKGQPVIGVIHKPNFSTKSETFWAWVGQAKSENLKYQKHDHDKTKIIISMSHSGEIRAILDKSLKNFEIVPAAGAGYKSIEVATGTVDAYLHITAIKKWDVCAGNAIIKAMGGKMTTKFNENIDYTDQRDVVNEKGLIATMENHDLFIGKL